MNIRLLILPLALGGLIAWGVWHRDKTASRISGTIEADDARLASRYGGRIQTLDANEGDTLTNGQLIATLAAPELAERRQALLAQLAEMLKGPRTEQIEAARKSAEALATETANAITEANRKTELFKINAATETERDAAITRARSLDSQTSAAKARLDELLAGTRPEQIERINAQLRELDTQTAELRLTAPAPCTLEMLHVKLGDVVAPNAPIATILYPANLWIRVYVPEPWLPRLAIGGTAKLRIDGLGTNAITATIEQINRRAEFTPRNVQTQDERAKQVFGVKLHLPDTTHLRPGMSAEVLFPAAAK